MTPPEVSICCHAPLRALGGKRLPPYLQCTQCGGKSAPSTVPVAISVPQPWAWLIAQQHCLVINKKNNRKGIDRTNTHFRGPFLLHASAPNHTTLKDYERVVKLARKIDWRIKIPPLHCLLKGGIIARGVIFRCDTKSLSPWFEGPVAFLVRNGVTSLPFTRYKQGKGFFPVIWDKDLSGVVRMGLGKRHWNFGAKTKPPPGEESAIPQGRCSVAGTNELLTDCAARAVSEESEESEGSPPLAP